jgi:uncharacterized protein (DUF736 family)
MPEDRKPLKEVGALWIAKSGNGWTGQLKETLSAGARLVVWPVRDKKNPRGPDMRIMSEDDSPAERPEEGQGDDLPF